MEFTELVTSKEITTTKINQLAAKGIFCVEDLLRYIPRGYYDYRTPGDLRNARNKQRIALRAKVISADCKKGAKRKYVYALCEDLASHENFFVNWFNPYVLNNVRRLVDFEVVVGGIITVDEYGKKITNPDVFTNNTSAGFSIKPIYSKIKGMSDEYFHELLDASIGQYNAPDGLSDREREYFNLIDEQKMISCIHKPRNPQDVTAAHKRLVYETLYPLAYEMVKEEKLSEKKSLFVPRKLKVFNQIVKNLPYELTEDQRKVIINFVDRAREEKRVNALIQGDVGCGKSVVAFGLMIMMSDNGYQSVLMAPTGILAQQHYNELKSMTEAYGLKTVYLGTNLKAKERRAILEQIKTGEADFIVGTHSVISDDVEYKNLGITIVDEEHKFGVEQREKLIAKANEGVHCVSMSATPIPRSLAISLYGSSMDIWTIESMPNGRKPIRTEQVKSDNSAFAFMEQEIRNGHQCYIVCPMIEEIEGEDDADKLASVEDVIRSAQEFFDGKGINVGAVTGKMKEDEKKEIINSFVNNDIQVLIATTIIEVGVNVPNATVITIMNAERFGLAGLHQLRGRVGRGNFQSYCILRSNDNNNPRLDVMCRTNNGFEIAEEDLKLRGTGDFLGTRQSGEEKNVMLMMRQSVFYNKIREYIKNNWND